MLHLRSLLSFQDEAQDVNIVKPGNISEVSRKKWELVEIRVPPQVLSESLQYRLYTNQHTCKEITPEDRGENCIKEVMRKSPKGHSTTKELVFSTRRSKTL